MAMPELLKRYRDVFRHAWQNRKAMAPKERLPFEAQFLPAALELQDTPVSPAPRVVMWLIIAFAILALAWSIFGKIDVVATARGKIIPSDRVKVIQPSETAVVKAIHVTEGQSVHKGDRLIDLDATITGADLTHAQKELDSERVRATRATSLLGMIDGGTRKHLDSQSPKYAEQRLLDGQIGEYQARLTTLDAEISRRDAELAVARDIVARLQQTAPLAAQRAKDYAELLEKNYVSRHDYFEAERVRIEQEKELAAQKNRIVEAEAGLSESRKQRELFTAETRRKALEEMNDAQRRVSALEQELVKAQQRSKLMRLKAPTDGVVQQLVVHTVGGVVTSAQPLMIIVPTGDTLAVEAFVENTDIGFVRAGQTAEVKIDSFPFTKYGTIDSEVTLVSHDAIEDEKRGLIFSARMNLERAAIQVEESLINLTPGMSVTVEIKTGKRRVIEYFLGPFLQHVDESLRER